VEALVLPVFTPWGVPVPCNPVPAFLEKVLDVPFAALPDAFLATTLAAFLVPSVLTGLGVGALGNGAGAFCVSCGAGGGVGALGIGGGGGVFGALNSPPTHIIILPG